MTVVAALYDVHGNLPALEAVLADDAFAPADAVVVGGDVASGPMPAEVLDRLAALDLPLRWVRGNADREVVDCFDRGDTDPSVHPADDPAARADAAARLAPMLEAVQEALVVCGHTHHQFDLRAGARRVVNAGSVGMPCQGEAAAFWLLVGDGEPDPRRTDYDVDAAMAQIRATAFPDVDDVMRKSLIEPVDPAWIARFLEDRATAGQAPQSRA